jgi:pSer/pThr/pTyr-binding forkhead associated (FHA) protein
MLKLHVVPPEGLPFDHPFTGDSLVVGRAADADLMLADPFLSRRHSRLFRAGSTVYVEDLGSRNGTLLNGQKVLEPSAIVPGDTVRISGSVLTLLEESPPAHRVTQVDSVLEDGTIFRNASECSIARIPPTPPSSRARPACGATPSGSSC